MGSNDAGLLNGAAAVAGGSGRLLEGINGLGLGSDGSQMGGAGGASSHQPNLMFSFSSIMDSSRVSTFLISMLLIVYGSFRSLNMEQESKGPYGAGHESCTCSCHSCRYHASSNSSSSSSGLNGNESNVQTLDTMQALCLPLGASVSLLVMFFFFDSMQLLFAICTAVIAAVALAFLLLPMCEYIIRLCYSQSAMPTSLQRRKRTAGSGSSIRRGKIVSTPFYINLMHLLPIRICFRRRRRAAFYKEKDRDEVEPMLLTEHPPTHPPIDEDEMMVRGPDMDEGYDDHVIGNGSAESDQDMLSNIDCSCCCCSGSPTLPTTLPAATTSTAPAPSSSSTEQPAIISSSDNNMTSIQNQNVATDSTSSSSPSISSGVATPGCCRCAAASSKSGDKVPALSQNALSNGPHNSACALVRQLAANRHRRRFAPCGPLCGRFALSEIISFTISVTIVCVWILTGHWLLMDAMGMALCVAFIAFVRLPSLKVSTLLLTGLLIYDVFWVFFSSYIFSSNVMVRVATRPADNPVNLVARRFHLGSPGFGPINPGTGFREPPKLSLPGKLIFPSMANSGHFSMLGLGDIVMPGLLLCFVLRYDAYKKAQARAAAAKKNDCSSSGSSATNSSIPSFFRVYRLSYFHCSLIGYFLGLVTATVSSEVFKAAQPALLYLVPFTLLPLLTMAYLKGDLGRMWSEPFNADMAASSGESGHSNNEAHRNGSRQFNV